MTKKTSTKIRPSAASLLIASLDSFGLVVKAQRRKIKPTVKFDPVKRNKDGVVIAPKKSGRKS